MKTDRHRRIVLSLIGLMISTALAGPPLLTDDPEPAGGDLKGDNRLTSYLAIQYTF